MEQETQALAPEQFLHFSLTVNEVNAVLAALSKAPLEHSLNAYMSLRNSAEQQIAALNARAKHGAGE